MGFDIVENFGSGGTYLKPAELSGALAVLITPTFYERMRKSVKYDDKDAIHMDMVVFHSEAAFDGGEVDERQGVIAQQGMIVRDLTPLAGSGKSVIGKFEQITTSNGKGFVIKPVDKEIQKKVVAWATKRSEALENAAADAPDFD